MTLSSPRPEYTVCAISPIRPTLPPARQMSILDNRSKISGSMHPFDTDPPPYTRPMPLLTISSPSRRAHSRYSGPLPLDAPQNTAILRSVLHRTPSGVL